MVILFTHQFMKSHKIARLFLLSIVVLCCRPPEKQAVSNPPNIVLIFVDDLGFGDLGYTGSTYYETPHIDYWASKGMKFNRAYASAANCAPSRANLMSGLFPSRHGIYTVGSSERGKSKNRRLIPTPNNITLPDSIYTLAENLNDHGYVTIHAGKWHLSADPRQHGFDINIGGSHAGHPPSYFYPYANSDKQSGINLGTEGAAYLTDRLTDRVLEVIDSLDKKAPFFLNFATYAVHTPLMAKPEKLKKFRAKEGDKRHKNAKYAAMISSLDENIGKLMTKLQDSGLLENTLVVFTSDNGGVYKISKQWPLRAGKGSYYEGGIREPMFMYWQGHLEAGSQMDIPVTNLDFYPTFLSAAGISPQTGQTFDGQSIFDLLENQQVASERELFWHFPIYLQGGNKETQDKLFRTRPGSALIKGDWKIIQYFEENDIELYNLRQDPSEKNDLSETEQHKKSEMIKILEKWRIDTNSPVPTKVNPEFNGLSQNTD